MSKILSHISRIILAGTNIEDQQMFDGIRNLANMSVVSYPKARFLQIILDPRMILNDGQIIMKCADFTFQEVREHLVEELGKRLTNKEMLMMLKSFVNQLLDNNEVMHLHIGYNTCESSEVKKISNLNLLYKKCQQLGLQYGFLNLFPAKILKKITRSRHKIVEQILNKVNHADEFKEILHLLSIDYQSGVNVVIIVSHILDSQNSIFRYVMSLPKAVIEIIIDYISLTSRKIEYSRISELLNLYNKKQDLFISVKKKPLLGKLFMLHDNFEVMNDFLDMIAFNNRRIAEIHSFNTSLSAFLFSHIGGNAQKDDAKAITKLGIINMKRCKSIISNTAIIKDLGLNICFLCDCANDFPKIFDLIFDNKSENLDIIYQIKKNRKISAESIIREVISLKSIDKVKEFFCRMNIEYDD